MRLFCLAQKLLSQQLNVKLNFKTKNTHHDDFK